MDPAGTRVAVYATDQASMDTGFVFAVSVEDGSYESTKPIKMSFISILLKNFIGVVCRRKHPTKITIPQIPNER